MARPGTWRREYPAPLFALQSELNRMFEEYLRPGGPESPAGPAPTAMAEAAWAPPVDLRDAGEAFVLAADVPGVDPATIDLSVTGDLLTLRGRRGEPEPGDPAGAGQAVVRECPSGPFLRQVRLPAEVDVDAIRAEARHGVLSIRLPKKSAAQPRTIRVQPA